MTKAGIIGATGYAGAELYRLLLNHPEIEISGLSSVSFTGQNISDIYPGFSQVGSAPLLSEDEVIEKCDVVFCSLPHGLSEKIAQKCLDQGAVCIDLGADFRLEDETSYKKWYENDYQIPSLHEESVYGLPELNRENIKKARLIGNPGCYPTSVALGLFPALRENLCKTENMIVDAKSGVTGAGRGLTQNTHYPDCNEAFAPYKVGAHRHTPEIEQTLTQMAKKPVHITFVPHLLPINRGIISTIYTDHMTKTSLADIHRLFCDFYQKEPFVRVMPLGSVANVKNVRLSNFCDISLHEDLHTNKLIIVAAIDNMVKGAAGQAIQNMNLVFGFEETAGLHLIPPAF
jgi:N-acetyl-gamma-glutamyl-phosphate reductase